MRMKYLPIASAVFLVIAMTIQFVLSYQRNKADIKDRINYKMELAQKDVTFELYDMVDAVSEIASYLPRNGKDTVALYNHIETVLWRFPYLYSCYFCYTPNYFPDQGKHYAVCAFRASQDSIISYHLETKFDYFERDWYKGAMLSDDKGFWSESYTDYDTDSLVSTYSVKAYDDDDNIIGVAGADFTLSWAKQVLLEARPYEDAECQLYGPGGTLIVQTGEADNWDKMIVSEKALSPAEMMLVIAVPNHHIWDGMIRVSLITFIVLVIGILVAGLLIRRLWQDQTEYVRAETENKVLEKELRIASSIQKGILRIGEREKVKVEDRWSDIEVQAALEPMREIGGDLYDFYRKEDDFYFIIGDVSGKSVPAAMFMSATVNLFRSTVRRLQSPKSIMEDINAVLSDNNPSLMFVTAFIGRLHITTGEVLYCNAGHLPPIVIKNQKSDNENSTREIDVIPNIPLGYKGTFRFEEQGTMLGKNETLLLYTDGITEARNEKREMLGVQRWRKMAAETIPLAGSDSINAIRKACVRYIGRAEQTDDMTIMTIRLTNDVQPLTLHLENRLDQLPVFRNALHNYGLCAGLDKRTLKRLEVALEEAVVNIINYSQATAIELRVESQKSKDERQFCIKISDNGTIFDPTAQKEVDTAKNAEERQIGGLGIALLRQMADELYYQRLDNKNILTIIKNL